jgi:hypothetical protein
MLAFVKGVEAVLNHILKAKGRDERERGAEPHVGGEAVQDTG